MANAARISHAGWFRGTCHKPSPNSGVAPKRYHPRISSRSSASIRLSSRASAFSRSNGPTISSLSRTIRRWADCAATLSSALTALGSRSRSWYGRRDVRRAPSRSARSAGDGPRWCAVPSTTPRPSTLEAGRDRGRPQARPRAPRRSVGRRARAPRRRRRTSSSRKGCRGPHAGGAARSAARARPVRASSAGSGTAGCCAASAPDARTARSLPTPTRSAKVRTSYQRGRRRTV